MRSAERAPRQLPHCARATRPVFLQIHIARSLHWPRSSLSVRLCRRWSGYPRRLIHKAARWFVRGCFLSSAEDCPGDCTSISPPRFPAACPLPHLHYQQRHIVVLPCSPRERVDAAKNVTNRLRSAEAVAFADGLSQLVFVPLFILRIHRLADSIRKSDQNISLTKPDAVLLICNFRKQAEHRATGFQAQDLANTVHITANNRRIVSCVDVG